MYRRLYRTFAVLTILPLLATGCTQATRHSNMMVFGTNTSVGLIVGTDATSVPSISVGFKRQEAVLLPLVANTGSVTVERPGQTQGPTGKSGGKVSTSGSESLLEPCDLTKPVVATGGQFAVHPCLLVAINGSAQDSYSVLASFGAQFNASAQSDDAKAAGGLAQYFATGMAAQLLALNGGASVVSVGGAAAENQPNAGAAKELFSNPAAYSRGVALAGEYRDFQKELIAFINSAKIAEADLPKQMAMFESDAGSNEGLAAQCAKKDPCLLFITTNDSYSANYPARKEKLSSALQARRTANGL